MRQCDILETLFHNQALGAQTHGENQPPFVIEVTEDDGHPLALLAECIRNWHTNLVECHECRARSSGVCGLNRLGGKLVTAWHEDDSVPAVGLAADGEVIRECAVRDPPVRAHIGNGPSTGSEKLTFWSLR
jgi:hypothetical protein